MDQCRISLSTARRDHVLSTASRKTGVSLFRCLSRELLPPESSVAEVLNWEGGGGVGARFMEIICAYYVRTRARYAKCATLH